MSVVKLSNGKNSGVMLRYLVHENERDIEIKLSPEIERKRYIAYDSLGLRDAKKIESAWKMTRETFGKNNQIKYHHAAISLNPADSKSSLIKDSELIEYGKSFMERFASGHDYAIAIHRDTEHPHIHLIWNSVNHDSGRKFHMAKGKAIDQAIKIKNELDHRHELKITPRKIKEHKIEHDHSIPLTDREIQILSRNPDEYMWKLDIASRIDASINHSKTIDGFRDHLEHQGVHLIERGKTRTYSFIDENGKARKIREKRLGEAYGIESITRKISERQKNHAIAPGYGVDRESKYLVEKGFSSLQHGFSDGQPWNDQRTREVGRDQQRAKGDDFERTIQSRNNIGSLQDTESVCACSCSQE